MSTTFPTNDYSVNVPFRLEKDEMSVLAGLGSLLFKLMPCILFYRSITVRLTADFSVVKLLRIYANLILPLVPDASWITIMLNGKEANYTLRIRLCLAIVESGQTTYQW